MLTPALRRLYAPRPVTVEVEAGGVPRQVDDSAVAAVREEWVVVDRWWTERTLQRRYFELALADGRAVVVFRECAGGHWYEQRA